MFRSEATKTEFDGLFQGGGDLSVIDGEPSIRVVTPQSMTYLVAEDLAAKSF